MTGSERRLPPLEEYGIDLATLKLMYREWKEKKVPKSVIERRYLGTARQHGKLFTRLVRDYLSVNTEQSHPLKARIAQLEDDNALLRRTLVRHGIEDPTRTPEINQNQLSIPSNEQSNE